MWEMVSCGEGVLFQCRRKIDARMRGTIVNLIAILPIGGRTARVLSKRHASFGGIVEADRMLHARILVECIHQLPFGGVR